MTATKRFIEDAIAGGWELDMSMNWYATTPNEHDQLRQARINKAMLDPTAWQAVGRTRGWKLDETKNYAGWQLRMHGLIDALAEGMNIEQYLQSIE